MKRKKFRIPLIMALSYWIPSSLALLNLMKGSVLLPEWLNSFLFPGYFLGFFAFGFLGINFLAFVGQIISLIIIFFISMGICAIFEIVMKNIKK